MGVVNHTRAVIPPFNWDQAAQIRAGKLTGCLVSGVGLPPKTGCLRVLRRRYKRLDGDGNLECWATETVTEKGSPVVLTVQQVSKSLDVQDVDVDHAKACGYLTAQDLGEAWIAAHPRSVLVRVVRFAVGDVRDIQPLLRFGAGHTLDRSKSPDPDAPVVPPDFEARLVEAAHMRDKRRQDKQRESMSMAERLSDVERRAGDGDMEARKHLFVIRQRIEKAEKREAA